MAKSSGAVAAFLLLCPTATIAHAVMKTPAPRQASGMLGTGTKLQPFADAQLYADNGCGGAGNGDPGLKQPPTIAYQSGAQVTVTWELTIPHPADNLDSGIRIAVHYGAGDSFSQNILTGGVVGSGNPGTVSAGLLTTTVNLPNGKTSDWATIQWVWSANGDGGSYVGCSDVAITTNGQLPNYPNPNAHVGEVLSGIPAAASGPGSIYVASPPPPPVGGGGSGSGGGGSNNVGAPDGEGNPAVPVAVLLLLGAAGGIGYYFWKQNQKAKGKGSMPAVGITPNVATVSAVPPPPPGAPALPPGWQEHTDPGTGRAYYYNVNTGASSWVVPDHV